MIVPFLESAVHLRLEQFLESVSRPGGLRVLESTVFGCPRCGGHRPLEIRDVGTVCVVCFGDAFSAASEQTKGADAIWNRAVELYLEWSVEHAPSTVPAVTD